MPRVHRVERARKSTNRYENEKRKAAGIKPGDSYYWWEFKTGGKVYSKTRPTRQQLTRSEFYQTLYDLEDEAGEIAAQLRAGTTDPQDASDSLDDLASRVDDYKSELESRLDNMPEGLQASSVLNERIEALDAIRQSIEEASGEVSNVELPEPPAEEAETDEEEAAEKTEEAEDPANYEAALEAAREEAATVIDNIEWSA